MNLATLHQKEGLRAHILPLFSRILIVHLFFQYKNHWRGIYESLAIAIHGFDTLQPHLLFFSPLYKNRILLLPLFSVTSLFQISNKKLYFKQKISSKGNSLEKTFLIQIWKRTQRQIFSTKGTHFSDKNHGEGTKFVINGNYFL